jgi:Ca2+-binding RTX toxin-like protein
MPHRSCTTMLAAAVAAVVVLAFGARVASAAVHVHASGGSLVIDTATGANSTIVGFNASNEITIRNDDAGGPAIVIGSPSGGCVYDATYANTIDCPAAPYNDLQATYGAGDDSLVFSGVCFPTATVALGEGSNHYGGEGCLVSHIAVSAGAGQDSFSGNDDPGTATVEVINAGGGDDNIQSGAGNDIIHGGDGNDRLYGGSGDDQVYGDAGDDQPDGGPGNDLVDGGTGNDALEYSQGVRNDAGLGADTYVGGPGTDRLWLDAHADGVSISLNGVADDGSSGEGDNVGADIEDIDGTAGNDVFIGSPGADGFSGGFGNDEIHGGGGDDHLYGGGGDDRIYGDTGNDKLEGANGADIVDGGPGADQIYGDIGSCSFSCSFDADTLLARDGERDTVDCGGGADTAQVDAVDVVAFCASVDRAAAPATTPPGGATPGGGGATPGSPTAGSLVLALEAPGSIRIAALLKGGLPVQVNCPAACSIVAGLSVKTSVGTARKALLKAGTTTLVVKIAKKSRRAIARLKRGTLTLRVKITDAAGKSTTLNRTVALKR